MLLRSSLVTLSLALSVTTAQGQGCVIETDDDPLLKGARLMIAKIADDNPTTSHVSEKPGHFKKQLINLYETSENIKNQIGRQYMLGRLYSIWLFINLPGTKTITTRGELNLKGNPKGSHDLYAAMDSAFTKVEEMNAACTDSTAKYRGAVSLMAYNDARAQLEAKNFDSAAVLARRSLVADPKGAAPWNILAEANRQRGDTVGYRQALRKVATSANSTDPVVRRVKVNALSNLAVMTLQDAQKAKDDAEKKRLAEEAEADLKELLKLDPNNSQALTGMSRVFALKGDTAAAKALTDDMVKNPDKYSAATLFEAAGAQFTSGEYAGANKLYEAGLSKNPAFRDALFSYVSSLLKAEQRDKALDVARRLLAGDPNGSNTLTQVAAVWSAIYGAASDDAARAKVQDSLLKYTELRTTSPVMTRDIIITPAADGATVEGIIDNKSDAPKSYQIEFEFLNATGGVVASGTATVADVPAKTGKRFNTKASGAGIVAWRYKPIKG